ncbi:podocalyxin-like protein 2 [Pelobates fuscus]|uniref:podocalyxin-like protein 2 n=1 Tax=Pelobates fuscus TaxID=191477 RepID=UPI002FE4D1A5
MHHPWHLILGFLCSVSANAEESHSEGLSSTSLLDLSPSHLRGVDSVEHEVEGYQDPDIIQEFLHTHQGSGFSSQETEESTILQSSQLFSDDEERQVNGTSDSNSALQTDYPPTTFSDGTIHGENRSNSPNQNQETSTSWLSTDSGELPRHVSTKTLAEEENIHPATNHSDVSEHPDHEWTVFTVTSGTPEQPTPRPPRKTKKHSASRKHHANHNPKSVPQTEHPLDSLLNVDDTHAFIDEDIKSMPTHSTQEKENVNLPKLFTQWDKSSTQKVVPTELQWGSEQVICNDWINLAGKNYVILNMSDDIDCEQFRWQKGQQLLSLLEEALSWKAETPQKDWVISLSKPNENDNHLLMTITEEQRVVPIKDVFTALGDIKMSLAEIGIESYSSTVVCESRPNQPRSDYGKLFVVLVIIGSVCVMIIIAGIIYICWQRRLPKLKNMELHFVENGCHDNPTLDVATDAQSEMQEKKTSLNGGTSHRADGWETLINTNSKEETEAVEEDTHL